MARHLYDIRTTAFIRMLMDQGIYVSMMIFAAGFRHLVRRARPESDWLGSERAEISCYGARALTRMTSTAR